MNLLLSVSGRKNRIRAANRSCERNSRRSKRTKNRKEEVLFEEIAKLWLLSSGCRLKPSTLAIYAGILSAHLEPEFRGTFVSDIDSAKITKFFAKKMNGEERLSVSTLRNISTVLKSILDHADRNGYEVCQSVSMVITQRKSKRESKVMDEDERVRFEEYLLTEPDPEKLGVLICMYSGIRLGELCALRWEDINMDNATLTIRRTIQRIKNLSGEDNSKTKVVFDKPKSESSNRIIPIPHFIADLMLKFRMDGQSFFLTGDKDHYLEPRLMQMHFKRMLTEAGVEKINFHAIRHTFATRCINLGIDAKTVSNILGHADVSMTLNTYVHPPMEQLRRSVELLAQ